MRTLSSILEKSKQRPILILSVVALIFVLALVIWWLFAKWWVLNELEKKYPPLAVEAKLNDAIAYSMVQLSLIENASALVSSPLAKLVPTAKKGFSESLELKNGVIVTLKDFNVRASGQKISVETSFVLQKKQEGISISGRISGFAIASVMKSKQGGLEFSIFPIIRSWKFEKISFGGIKFNLASIVNVLSLSITSSASQISERLGEIRTPIAITSDAKTIDLPGKDGSIQKITIPGYKATSFAILADDNSVFVLLKLQDSSHDVSSPSVPNGKPSFIDFRNKFEEIVNRDFKHKLNAPTDPKIELSQYFLSSISSAVPNKVTASEQIHRSIDSNKYRLDNASPAAGFFVSARKIKELILEQIKVAGDDLVKKKIGKISEPNVEVSGQAITLSGRLEQVVIAHGVSVTGRVSGVVTPISESELVRVPSAFQSLELENFAIAGWQLDPVKVILLLQHSQETLLPAINALIRPEVIELKTAKPGAARLIPKTGTTSVSYSPSEILLPTLTLGDPVVLVDSSGLRAFVSVIGINQSNENVFRTKSASLTNENVVENEKAANLQSLEDQLRRIAEPLVRQFADATRLLSFNAASPSNSVAKSTSPQAKKNVTFADYKKQFDEKWEAELGKESPSSADAFGYVRKSIVATYINAAWPKNGVTADVIFNEVSQLKDTSHRIGYINTNLDCKRTRECKRGACKRGTCALGKCSRGSCGRAPGECSYGCEICWRIGSDLTGYYKDCKPDPVCEAGKLICNAGVESRVAACNTREESAYAACILAEGAAFEACNAIEGVKELDCNLREEAALLDCNRLAEMEVGACNIRKEALKGISNLGDIGSSKGEMAYYGRGAVVLRGLQVADSMDSISVIAKVNANGIVSADVTFVPSGGVGHILGCLRPITFKPVSRASVDNELGVNASASFLQRDSDGRKKLVYAISIPEIMGTGKLSPAPADALFISNPEMIVVCPILSKAIELSSLLGKGLTLITGKEIAKTIPDDNDVVKALKEGRNSLVQFGGGVAYLKVDPQVVDIDIPEIDLIVSGQQNVLTPKEHKGAVLYELADKQVETKKK